MNTLAFHDEPHAPQLVDFVDFKWLMAREGHRVDAQRMQTDPVYARKCLALAHSSASAVLRGLTERLLEITRA